MTNSRNLNYVRNLHLRISCPKKFCRSTKWRTLKLSFLLMFCCEEMKIEKKLILLAVKLKDEIFRERVLEVIHVEASSFFHASARRITFLLAFSAFASPCLAKSLTETMLRAHCLAAGVKLYCCRERLSEWWVSNLGACGWIKLMQSFVIYQRFLKHATCEPSLKETLGSFYAVHSLTACIFFCGNDDSQ